MQTVYLRRVAKVIVLLSAFVVATRARGQSFEVASIKQNGTGERGSSIRPLRNSLFAAKNASLKSLLSVAFGLTTVRISGPTWLEADRFDIEAKAPDGTEGTSLMEMLQSLFKDRFHLEIHREMKTMPAYQLLIAEGGSKLRPFDPTHPQVPPPAGAQTLMGVGTTSQLAEALAGVMGRPVVDKTGIEGKIFYNVAYSPLSAGDADSEKTTAPDILAAVREQLGLTLHSQRELVEILVVDHIDRVPTEN